jgi:hypothetical protein
VHTGDPCAAGAECNNFCNEAADTCFNPAGTFCGDEGTQCTNQDLCNGMGSCTDSGFKPPGTLCGDENICNGIETCDGSGTCQQGTSLDCKVTGGGQIDGILGEITILRGTNVGGRANFGFNAQLPAGASTPTGNLTYIDHTMNKKVKSISIDSLVIIGNTATFKGMATINGQGNYSFEVTVQDMGEPGSSAAVTPDDFSIMVGDGYTAAGFLIAGNIQVHSGP